MYNDKLIYKVVIWVLLGLFYEKEKEALTKNGHVFGALTSI